MWVAVEGLRFSILSCVPDWYTFHGEVCSLRAFLLFVVEMRRDLCCGGLTGSTRVQAFCSHPPDSPTTDILNGLGTIAVTMPLWSPVDGQMQLLGKGTLPSVLGVVPLASEYTPVND